MCLLRQGECARLVSACGFHSGIDDVTKLNRKQTRSQTEGVLRRGRQSGTEVKHRARCARACCRRLAGSTWVSWGNSRAGQGVRYSCGFQRCSCATACVHFVHARLADSPQLGFNSRKTDGTWLYASEQQLHAAQTTASTPLLCMSSHHIGGDAHIAGKSTADDDDDDAG